MISRLLLVLALVTISIQVTIHVTEVNDTLNVAAGDLLLEISKSSFSMKVKYSNNELLDIKSIDIGQFLGVYLPLYLGYLFQFGVDTYSQHAIQTMNWQSDDHSVYLTIDSSTSWFVKNHT
jgi:hypothetical protein